MPGRSSRNLGGDLLAVGIQVALAVGIPLLVAAVAGSALDQRLGTTPWGLLLLTFVGLTIAGIGVFAVIRAYLAANPLGPTTDEARAAGRRWESEIEERERRRETDEKD